MKIPNYSCTFCFVNVYAPSIVHHNITHILGRIIWILPIIFVSLPSMRKVTAIGLMLFCMMVHAGNGGIRLADGVLDSTQTATLGLQPLPSTETVTVFSPDDTTDHYANGVVMTAFKGKLYCMWQSSKTDEDSDDTWVAYSCSEDEGKTWCSPRPLVKATDQEYHTSGGWLVYGDTLIAFIDTWQRGVEPRGGYTYYIYSTDGKTWSKPQPVKMADGSEMKGVLEQDPYLLPDGRLIGAVHFQPGLHVCPVYTDDPSGRTGWQRGRFEGEDRGKQSRELEPSQFLQADGTVTMIFRDQSSSFRKLASYSNDRGVSWTKPTVTAIPDARTKQCAGNLPDGTAYMVCCPVNGKQRFPLILLLSKDGLLFNKGALLRSGGTSDLPARRYDGKYKTLGYNYPKALVYDGWLYVSYATNKEDVQYTRICINDTH